MIQNWWWSVWPPLLRRRKAAALVIQSIFRGFLQRQRWHAIIRLRTSWGNTRIVAHGFVIWRGKVAVVRRVRAFVGRFRRRSMVKCWSALVCNVTDKKNMREELLRERLRRVAQGVRLRVFEAWARYTEISLAVNRMRYRASVLPAFRGWRETASEDRIQARLHWACAVLVSRMIRWKQKSRYGRLRKSCVMIQVVARKKIASDRVKRKTADSRVRRAEEAVQALEVCSNVQAWDREGTDLPP